MNGSKRLQVLNALSTNFSRLLPRLTFTRLGVSTGARPIYVAELDGAHFIHSKHPLREKTVSNFLAVDAVGHRTVRPRYIRQSDFFETCVCQKVISHVQAKCTFVTSIRRSDMPGGYSVNTFDRPI